MSERSIRAGKLNFAVGRMQLAISAINEIQKLMRSSSIINALGNRTVLYIRNFIYETEEVRKSERNNHS